MHEGWKPGAAWRWIRRLTQLLALLAISVGPALGGWQRLDRSRLSNWDGLGWDLPEVVMQRLPTGEPAARAYAVNDLLGGGTTVDYFGVPIVDPVAGAVALAWTSSPTLLIAVAWLMPVVLALVAGRVFCGWFCPFGTLSRMLDIGLRWAVPRWRRFELPRKRSLRFVILAAAVIAGMLGSQSLLYLLLPHALVEQSSYGLLLMGGGGAALGALAGLLVVGLVFGPTAYCATICPTGAGLAALGRARVVRLQVVDESRCGRACVLCDRGCWLDLRPSTGDAGPDCDLCGRCTELCPHANLNVTISRRGKTIARSVYHSAALLLIGLFAAAGCSSQRAWREDPGLLLETVVVVDGVEVFISVVDVEGVRPDPDDAKTLEGAELSVYVVRGARGEPNAFGKLPKRDVYEGPLDAAVIGPDGRQLVAPHFEQPNYPYSVGWRTIYRTSSAELPEPGTRVEVAAIPGWTSSPAVAVVPSPNRADSVWRLLGYFAASAAAFAGLIALGLAANRHDDPLSAGKLSDAS